MPVRPSTPSDPGPLPPKTRDHGHPDPSRRRRRLEGFLAFLGYGALSTAFFAGPALGRLSRVYVGWGADPTTFIWYLRWWPYALGRGLNPFATDLLWAPEGVNLASGTPIPGPALLASPLTLTLGPVVAYDVLALAAPALTAWAGYVLCRHLTGRLWPSLVGGYLFGFSTYELGRVLGHLNLGLAFLVPLLVLLVVKRMEGSVEPRRFVVLSALLVAGQFLVSSEVLFTLTIFGAAALGLGYALADPGGRRRLARTVGWLVLGYTLAGAVLAPLVIASLGRALATSPIYDFYPTFYSSDLLNFIVPTTATWLASSPASVAARFTGNLSEQVAYVGLPALAIVAAFALRHRRSASGRLLLGMLAIVLVATLGPKLHVGGRETVWMPWKLVADLPLFRYALPGRFMLYGFLILAVMVATWLSEPSRLPALRWMLAALAVVSLMPNVGLGIWRTDVDTPAFFALGTFRRYVDPGDNLLIIPFGDRGSSMLWQAQTEMAFRMPSGYVTVVPPQSFSRWPILRTFYEGELVDGYERQLKGFLGAHDVSAVVVKDGHPGPWDVLFGTLGAVPIHAGGITLYQVPAEVLAAYADATPPG